MDRSLNLLDYHNRLIADILSRFRTLCLLATSRATATSPDLVNTSLAGMSMDLEFEALATSVKELLNLSRRIKELWVFGPLGKESNESEEDREERRRALEATVGRVADLLAVLEDGGFKELVEREGGTWVAMPIEGKDEGH